MEFVKVLQSSKNDNKSIILGVIIFVLLSFTIVTVNCLKDSNIVSKDKILLKINFDQYRSLDMYSLVMLAQI